MNRYLTLSLLLICINCVLAQYPRRKPEPVIPRIDRTCLDCICQASSDCDETAKCHNAGSNAYFCGPYVISWGYWHDAGRPGDKGKPHDFETCLNDKQCAETTVSGYMSKKGRDCNGDGVIDCLDFARIHKLGAGECHKESILYTDYHEKFQACYPSYGNGFNDDGNDKPGAQGDYGDYGDGSLDARRTGQQG